MTEQAKQSPTSFGKYQILEELGRGGFGIVYKARDSVLGRLVALKVLHPELLVNRAFLDRFRQEACISAQLDHPNLIPVHDFGQIEGKYYLAMGYMPGGSLKDLLQQEDKLEPQRAYEVLAQVSEGLEYAHARGIIHRDLKPGNILFDENCKARVADMGFAKVMSEGASRSMSASGSLIGTPAYLAPETWRNKPATPQTDIYSLGCILYEMLTGKVLFEGDSPADIMTLHVIDGPEYAPELSKEMRTVFDKALKQEPEERYSDVKDFLGDFKAVMKVQEKPTVLKQISYFFPDPSPDVKGVTWSPDGKRLASGSTNKKIILWDSDSGERLRSLKGHKRTVESVAWSPDGESLASGSRDGTIILWNAISGERLRTLEGHTRSVNSVAWSSDGKTIASGSNDRSIILWDAISGESLRTLGGHTSNIRSVAWSPDGKILASGSNDNTIILWDADNGERLLTLEGHTSSVYSVSWSPDGKTLVSGSYDNTIILWKTDSGERLRTLKGHKWYGYVHSVAWSPDGKTLASGSSDKTIILWDAGSGEKLKTLKGHTECVRSVAWSSDSKWLASASLDGTIRLWGIP